MARGRTYNKTYADVHMKEDIIREVGSFLEELIVKDIAPLKMIKKDFLLLIRQSEILEILPLPYLMKQSENSAIL